MGCGLKPLTSQKQVGDSNILSPWSQVCPLVQRSLFRRGQSLPRSLLGPFPPWVARDGHPTTPIAATPVPRPSPPEATSSHQPPSHCYVLLRINNQCPCPFPLGMTLLK